MQEPVDTLTVEPLDPVDSYEGGAGSQPDDAPTFTRGASLGRYVILEAIGRGGMGTIFSAYDPELDRKVAIKVLHRRLLLSEARGRAEARLLREARAVARLEHPNVVSVYDVGETGGCLFIAMELVEGQSLASWLQEHTERPWQEVVEIFEKAGHGLAAAHRAGLVHRDFKPGNVMLARDGRVLVVDFGLARLPARAELEATPETKLASGQSGAAGSTGESPNFMSRAQTTLSASRTLGTPAYMAPEQWDGRSVDARADQYSFCVSLYQALYGELPPVSDPAARSVGDSTKDEGTASLVTRGTYSKSPGLGPLGTIHQALLRGLCPDPEDRFPRLEDLLAEIDQRRWRRRRRVAMGLLVSALAVVGLVAVFGRSQNKAYCSGAEQRLAGVWDGPRQSALRQLILASDRPYAENIWGTVKGVLDDYTWAWQEQHTEACEATHLRGEQSSEMLDRRMACLDERLIEVREVTALLLRGEPEVLARSVDAVHSLRRLAACRDRTALLGLPVPLKGEARQRQLEIQGRLASVRALEAAGRFRQVVDGASAALVEAEDLGDRLLVGEAHFWLAMGVGRLGRFAELREHLMRASYVALAMQDDELLARSLIRLVVTDSVRGQAVQGKEWALLAEGVVERLSGRVDLEAMRLQSLCFLATNMRGYDEAVAYCRKALDTDPDMPPQDRSVALNNLGIALVGLGRPDEALETYDESLALIKALYGDQHPNYAGTLSNVGDVYNNRREFDKAEKALRHALAVEEQSYGPRSPRLVAALAGLGAALMGSGEAREAAALLQRAIDLEPPDPAHMAILRFDLAAALWAVGKEKERALDLAAESLEGFLALGEAYQAESATAKTWLEERR